MATLYTIEAGGKHRVAAAEQQAAALGREAERQEGAVMNDENAITCAELSRHAGVLLRYVEPILAAQGDAADRELVAAQHALAELFAGKQEFTGHRNTKQE